MKPVLASICIIAYVASFHMGFLCLQVLYYKQEFESIEECLEEGMVDAMGTELTIEHIIITIMAITMGLDTITMVLATVTMVSVIITMVFTTTIMGLAIITTLDGTFDQGGTDMSVDGHLGLYYFKGGDPQVLLLLSLL